MTNQTSFTIHVTGVTRTEDGGSFQFKQVDENGKYLANGLIGLTTEQYKALVPSIDEISHDIIRIHLEVLGS